MAIGFWGTEISDYAHVQCEGHCIKGYKEILFRAREEFIPYDPSCDEYVEIARLTPNYCNKYYDWKAKYSDLMTYGCRMIDEGLRLGVLTKDTIVISPNPPRPYKGWDAYMEEGEEFEKEYEEWKKKKDLKARHDEMQRLNDLKSQMKMFTKDEAKAILSKLLDNDIIDDNATHDEMLNEIYTYCKLDKELRRMVISTVEKKIEEAKKQQASSTVQTQANVVNLPPIEPIDIQTLHENLTEARAIEIMNMIDSTVDHSKEKKGLLVPLIAFATRKEPGLGQKVRQMFDKNK